MNMFRNWRPEKPSHAAKAFRGALASTAVFLFLFVFGSLLSGGPGFVVLPVAVLMLAVTVLPTSFLLALPLAAVIRHRALGALAGAVWILLVGSVVSALLGADVSTLIFEATLFLPAGAALGLGVGWERT
jgi:hypothetical protein